MKMHFRMFNLKLRDLITRSTVTQLFLFARSNWYRDLFASDEKAKVHSITGSFNANIAILKYLYEDKFDLSDEIILEVILLARARSLHRLSVQSQQMARETISDQNIFSLFDFVSNPKARILRSGIHFWIGYRVKYLKKAPQWSSLSKETQLAIQKLATKPGK